MLNVEVELLKLFHSINNDRSKERQFSDYRLGEMARDVGDLFTVQNEHGGSSMKLEILINSIRDNAEKGVYNQEDILLLCDKAQEVVQKYKPHNKFSNLSEKDMKESMEARNRAWHDEET